MDSSPLGTVLLTVLALGAIAGGNHYFGGYGKRRGENDANLDDKNKLAGVERFVSVARAQGSAVGSRQAVADQTAEAAYAAFEMAARELVESVARGHLVSIVASVSDDAPQRRGDWLGAHIPVVSRYNQARANFQTDVVDRPAMSPVFESCMQAVEAYDATLRPDGSHDLSTSPEERSLRSIPSQQAARVSIQYFRLAWNKSRVSDT